MFYFLLYTYLVVVSLAFLCGLVSFRYTVPQRFTIFSYFLALTLVIELMGNIFMQTLHVRGKYRNGMYNVFALFEFLFYTYFLYASSSQKLIRKLMIAFVAIFPVAWALLVFDAGGIFQFHGEMIATGGFFIVCFSLAYLYFLSGSPETRDISRIPEFWIAIGLILFYCCQTPYMGSINYLAKNHMALAKSILYLSIFINTLMYGLFGYAFLCLKKNYS